MESSIVNRDLEKQGQEAIPNSKFKFQLGIGIDKLEPPKKSQKLHIT